MLVSLECTASCTDGTKVVLKTNLSEGVVFLLQEKGNTMTFIVCNSSKNK